MHPVIRMLNQYNSESRDFITIVRELRAFSLHKFMIIIHFLFWILWRFSNKGYTPINLVYFTWVYINKHNIWVNELNVNVNSIVNFNFTKANLPDLYVYFSMMNWTFLDQYLNVYVACSKFIRIYNAFINSIVLFTRWFEFILKLCE